MLVKTATRHIVHYIKLQNGEWNIGSFNECKGFNDKIKRRDIFKRLKEKNIQIACLQDIHINEKMEKYVKAEWGLVSIISHYTSNARGVAILFNKNFEYTIHKYKCDPNGNFVALDVTLENYVRLTLINIYGPNEDNPDFYININSIISDFENDSVLMCGDWNLVLNPILDTYNYKHINNPKARDQVLSIMEERVLTDVWRVFHNDQQYTWHLKNPIKMARLDFFLASEDILSLITDANINVKYKSDHSPVQIQIQISKHTQGKGSWKFNNSLLKDNKFVKLVKDKISEIKFQYAVSPYNPNHVNICPNREIQFQINDQLFFETLLVQLRGIVISYSAKKKRDRLKLEVDLEKKIEEIEGKIKRNPQNYNKLTEKLEETNLEIENIRNEKIKGTIIRSRARWYEAGEKSSSYFCNLEKRNYVNKTIQELEQEGGKTIKQLDDIMNAQKYFYSKLYKGKDTVEDIDNLLSQYIDRESIIKLSEDEKEAKEGLITYNELLAALKKTKNNKSPGMDGYTIEFYKFFWIDIGYFLLRSINYAYTNNQLSVTQQQGIITCIPKPGKPRNQLKNWRPISLLNTSYKLASSCIAERIKTSLNNIIHEDQKGFIPGRFIGENTRLIYDIMHETDKSNIPGLLMIIDFEKAFDTVSWEYIQKVLEIFNFGESIRKWVNIFYKDANSTIIQNGHFSQFFKIGRGCRQGDPLSPYIFILCVEIMGIAIRNNPEIKGIKIGDTEHKLTQFADDTTLFLDDDEDSLNEVKNLFKWFHTLSGLKINYDKTNLVWIGSMKESDRRFCRENDLVWTHKDNFTILGMTFNINMSKMEEINFVPKIAKVKNLLKIWQSRNLTPLGKITVIKTLVLPIITHLLTSLPDPSTNIIKEIESMFFNFIWNKRRDKIKRDILIQNYEDGGLKMVNVKKYITSLKVSWIRRLLFSKSSWTTLINKNLPDDYYCLGANFKTLQIQNPFWKCVFQAWADFNSNFNASTVEDVFNQPLWHNNKLNIEYIPAWHKKGLLYLGDLFDIHGKLYTWCEVKNKYQIKGTFLDYNRLIINIPKEWLRLTQGNITNLRPRATPAILNICNNIKGCRKYYDILATTKSCKSIKSQHKWNTELDVEPESTVTIWKYAYKIAMKASDDTNLRYFQYRILHRILTTNRYLKIIGLKNSDLCTFCNEEAETILHLMATCKYVKNIWQSICNWFVKCGYLQLNHLNESDIILGSQYMDGIINQIIIIAKFVIYRSKIKNKTPTFAMIKAYLRYIMDIEKYIAYTNQQQDAFLGKWSSFIAELK